MKFKLFTACLAVVVWAGTANATLINNGSFETGDFTGWVTQDPAPFFVLQVGGAGITPGFGLFTSAPTNGSFAALHGFDGGGPMTIRIGQDILVTPGAPIINFDYRGGWDMVSFGGSTMARLFDINIEVAGGGANLLNTNVLTAAPNSQNLDTGALSGSVDLSSFAGQTVFLSFDWMIPENLTGPGFFQLDNVTSSPAAVPEPSILALFGLGLAGLGFARRKKA